MICASYSHHYPETEEILKKENALVEYQAMFSVLYSLAVKQNSKQICKVIYFIIWLKHKDFRCILIGMQVK